MNLTFLLIRHAECIKNTQPETIGGRYPSSPLTDKGIQQSQALGEYLAKIPVQEYWCSPILRARQTAEYANLGVPHHHITPHLTELSQGVWEGMNRQEVYNDKQLNKINTMGKWFVPPEGESQRMVERRMVHFIEDFFLDNMKYESIPTTIGLVTHGMAIKCLLHGIFGFNDRYTARIAIDNTSITKIRYTDNGWHLDSMNTTPHL